MPSVSICRELRHTRTPMNPPNWADVTVALTSVATLLVTAAGLWAVFIQIRKLRVALWSDTQGRLCDQSFELLRFLAERPETYDYFYKNKPLEQHDPNRAYILYAAEALANFMEHLILQRANLPEHQWSVWHRFIISSYENCPVLQDFLQTHRSWYASEFLAPTDTCNRQTAPATPQT